jgi:hypothetical protein
MFKYSYTQLGNTLAERLFIYDGGNDLTESKKNNNFVGILKITDEKSRIRTRNIFYFGPKLAEKGHFFMFFPIVSALS